MGASRLVIACSTICRCVGSSFSARLFDSLAICSYAPCFPKTLGYLSCARSHWETEWWNEMLMCSALFFLLTPLFSVSLHFSLRIYLFIYLSILFFCFILFFWPFSWSCRVGLHRKARVPVWWVHLAVARLIWFDFLFFICEYSYVISPNWNEKKRFKSTTPLLTSYSATYGNFDKQNF